MNKKGLGNAAMVFIILLVVVVAVGAVGYMWYTGQQTTAAITAAATTTAVDYDAEFRDADIPDDAVGGNIATETAYNESTTSDTFDIAYDTTTDLENSTVGNTYTFPMMISLGSGGVEDYVVECDLSTTTSTEMVFSNAYVMLDEEGKTVNSGNALTDWEVEIDEDLDNVKFEHGAITDDKDYIFVVDMQVLVATGLETDDDIIVCTAEIDTDGDIDEGTLTVEVG